MGTSNLPWGINFIVQVICLGESTSLSSNDNNDININVYASHAFQSSQLFAGFNCPVGGTFTYYPTSDRNNRKQQFTQCSKPCSKYNCDTWWNGANQCGSLGF